MRTKILILIIFLWFMGSSIVCAEQEDRLLVYEMLESCTELQTLERELPAILDDQSISFREIILQLLQGELPMSPENIWNWIRIYFFRELSEQKEMVLQILMIALVSAVTSNVIRVFENAQIAEISFYIIFMMISVLVIRSFSKLNELARETCASITDFMELLMPPYLMTVIFSSGKRTGIGMYEITVFTMQWVQVLIVRVILPVITLYMTFLILSQMSKEDYFSKFASFFEMAISWILKTLFGLTVGMQAVQCLIAPAVDRLNHSAAKRMAGMIPGIGTMVDSAAETVAGAALVLKNAVGIAGMIILLFLCMTPVVKLTAAILLYRLLGAVLQPVCDKRLVEGIESVARGSWLLLRTVLISVSAFLISLAMITAFVYG